MNRCLKCEIGIPHPWHDNGTESDSEIWAAQYSIEEALIAMDGNPADAGRIMRKVRDSIESARG